MVEDEATGPSSPVLHLIAGPNGAGRSSLYARLLGPATGLPFVNADRIAAPRWPDDTVAHAYDAARAAAAERAALIAARRSFVTETIFSHPSKIELLEQARAHGHLTTLHVVMVPEDLSVVRVGLRVWAGGHDVTEAKIGACYRRLFALVADAADTVDETVVTTTAGQGPRSVALPDSNVDGSSAHPTGPAGPLTPFVLRHTDDDAETRPPSWRQGRRFVVVGPIGPSEAPRRADRSRPVTRPRPVHRFGRSTGRAARLPSGGPARAAAARPVPPMARPMTLQTALRQEAP